MRRNNWLVLGFFSMSAALAPTELMAQRDRGGSGGGGSPYGGGGFPGGGGGGSGRPQMDPEMLWQRMSGGSDSIDLNKNAQAKMMVQMGGGQMPPDGILTKTMFQTAMAQRAARTAGPGGPIPGSPVAPVPGGGTPTVISVGGDEKPSGMGGPGSMPPGGYQGGGFQGGGRGMSLWGDPENLFQRIDRNKDGKITKDETQMLLPYFDQIDTNKDGSIDLAELKVYSATMVAASPSGGSGGWSGPGGPGSGGGDPKIEDSETVRPVVYRFGKLPKDFPYASIDKDEDGQVSLYEWRNAGKLVEEFLDRDLNGDGFLTAEEWLRGTKTSLGDAKDKGGRSGYQPGGSFAASGDKGDKNDKNGRKGKN